MNIYAPKKKQKYQEKQEGQNKQPQKLPTTVQESKTERKRQVRLSCF